MRMAINKATAAREKKRCQGRLSNTDYISFSYHQKRQPLTLKRYMMNTRRHWFSSPEIPNFFTYHEIDWSNLQDSKEEFMNYLCIPLHIRENIWNALTVPKYDGPAVKATLEEVTTRPVTFAELKAAISKASSTSVPGPSGPFYIIMKTWTPKVLKEVFNAMIMIWETGQIPL